jgi:hypothetical protein
MEVPMHDGGLCTSVDNKEAPEEKKARKMKMVVGLYNIAAV